MDVKEAIATAKAYIADIYSDEGVFNVGLEEVEFGSTSWDVTIGFSRRWDRPRANPFTMAVGQEPDTTALSRTYKVVQIDDETGRVLGVRNRVGLA
jgi:hypothetical protein